MLPNVKNLHIGGHPSRFVYYIPQYAHGRLPTLLTLSTITTSRFFSDNIDTNDLPGAIRFYWLDIGDYNCNATANQGAMWRIAIRCAVVPRSIVPATGLCRKRWEIPETNMEAVFRSGISWIFSDDFQADPAGSHCKLLESTGKNPRHSRPEYCFQLPSIFRCLPAASPRTSLTWVAEFNSQNTFADQT
jgi:hypothetical protein